MCQLIIIQCTSWQRHFILENGTKAEGLQEIDGKHYLFDSDGYPLNGWTYSSFYDKFGGRIDNFTTDTGRVDQDGDFHIDHHFDDEAYWISKILEYGYDQNVKESQISKTGKDGIEHEYTHLVFPFVGGAEDDFKYTGVTQIDCFWVALATVRYTGLYDSNTTLYGWNKDGVYFDFIKH